MPAAIDTDVANAPGATDLLKARMLDALNAASLVLMASIGHRTGLFDAMAAIPPAGCETIAREAGLSERYVREWLGAMVAAGVVLLDPVADTYRLPPEHAACLTRSASPNNLAVAAQWISVIAGAEDQV